jgi:hypothetical protein
LFKPCGVRVQAPEEFAPTVSREFDGGEIGNVKSCTASVPPEAEWERAELTASVAVGNDLLEQRASAINPPKLPRFPRAVARTVNIGSLIF